MLAFLARQRRRRGPRLGHVGLAAAQPGALAGFYADLLGLEVVRGTDNPLAGALVALRGSGSAEDHELVLVSRSEAAHVAFRVADRDMLASAHARAHAAGIPIVGAFDLGDAHSLIVRDPEGNAVELYWPTGLPHRNTPEPLVLGDIKGPPPADPPPNKETT
jgi:catechol-2,3-dioxygenase